MSGFGGGGGGPGGGGGGPGGPGGPGGRRRGRRGRRGGRRRRGGEFGGQPAFGGPAHGQGHGAPRSHGGPLGGTSPEDRGQSSTLAGDRLLVVQIDHDGPIPAAATDKGVSPFALFAACVLGITESDGYRTPSVQDVARRFGLPPALLPDLLRALALDAQSLRACDFDLVGAQMDIQVAPNGMSRTELAKDIYRELLKLPKRAEVVRAAAVVATPPPGATPEPSPTEDVPREVAPGLAEE